VRVRLRLAAVLICVPVALASAVALASTRETFCTLMAGPSGLHVVVPRPAHDDARDAEARRLARAHPGWSLRRVLAELRRRAGSPEPDPIRRITVCVRQRCATHRGPSPADLSGRPVAPGYQRLAVRVVLEYRDGRRKVLRTRVTMRPQEINGPRCGTDWVAYAHVQGDRLVVDR
jgi:hypothetical protein